MKKVLLIALVCGAASCAPGAPKWQKMQLTREFWAEGAHYGDFNRDGRVDVVCGAFWYEAPGFERRHEIWPATATFKRTNAGGKEEVLPGFEGALGAQNAYSDNFLTFTYDFNGDGWMDVMAYPWPGKAVAWYENPKNKPGPWPRYEVFDVLDNESPGFMDVTGDKRPEMLCCSKGYIGYVEADWKNPAAPWTFRPVSPKGNYERYSHGIGAGDINGDKRMDLVEKDGWWERPANWDGKSPWKMHPVKFAPAPAQMLVYDVNGDKLQDVITAVNAHGYGLVWWEQTKTATGERAFQEHVILNKEAGPNAHGVSFSQPHALALHDMDGDGLMDVVTGKRFWAHGPTGDVEPNAPAVLYWFQLQRPAKGRAEFVPHLVDNDSGVGTQVAAGFITNRKKPDIVVGNKKGLFLFKAE